MPALDSVPPPHMFPALTAAQIARVDTHGRRRRVEPGDVLVERGDPARKFFVVVSGELEIVGFVVQTEDVVSVLGAGQFTGEVYLLETSLPGVFAVGDVRSGNIKRVASAVGEGAIAVALVHQLRQR